MMSRRHQAHMHPWLCNPYMHTYMNACMHHSTIQNTNACFWMLVCVLFVAATAYWVVVFCTPEGHVATSRIIIWFRFGDVVCMCLVLCVQDVMLTFRLFYAHSTCVACQWCSHDYNCRNFQLAGVILQSYTPGYDHIYTYVQCGCLVYLRLQQPFFKTNS